MRQSRSFPPVHPPAQPEAGPTPSRRGALRRRLSRFYHRFHSVLFLGAGILIALTAVFLHEMGKPPPQHLTQRDINAAVERALASATPGPSYESRVYEIIRPSVVSVLALTMPAGGKTESALGTGVVIDDSGTILTSLHIVRDAAEVRVVFADGTESEASVVVGQPENDLAVLRPAVIPDDLLPATLSSSAAMSVGDEVVAVGNPFGMRDSLSSGVVSGFGRTFRVPETGETLRDLIQFDAAVNPGNSGGPLVNRNGEVIGIITALFNPTEQRVFIGIGFAVPIETAAAAAGAPPL